MELKTTNDKQKTRNPLVSIIVLTYNSSKFVIEMLESIKAQTYANIELIVSDDCSTDETVDICRNWIDINKSRFTYTHLITVEQNTGISANCNRGNNVANGEWIKSIAGDDILCTNAIDEYIKFVLESQHQICCAKLDYFGDDKEAVENTRKHYNKYFSHLAKPLKEQQKLILKLLFIPGPGVFHSKKLYEMVKGYDERFPMGEEWPYYFRILQKGFPIALLNKELVKYRISSSSASKGHQFGVSKRVFDSTKDYFFKVRLWNMLKHFMFFSAWHQILNYTFMGMKHKEKGRLELSIFKLLYLFDPIRIIKIFNKRLTL